MTSCHGTVKILLLLCLVLPVTPESVTASPSTSSKPAEIPEAVTASATNEPETDQATEEPEDSNPPEPDIGIGNQTLSAVNEEVLNATITSDSTTVFGTLTTLLADTEPTTTDSPATSTSPAVTRRNVTTFENATHAKDDSRRQEHDRIFLYDYGTLRQWGLISALLLCIIGFLVLFGGRCRGLSCRRRQRRKYNITGL